MKIVNILGGLGNQMFEYAMYLALKAEHPKEKLLCSTRSMSGYHLHNGLELERVFGISIKEASIWDLLKLAYPFFNYKSWQVMWHILPQRKSMSKSTMYTLFDKFELEREESVFYDGYWQNENYFKSVREHVLNAFTFPPFDDKYNLELAQRLSETISVSCHVRRGDYLKEPQMCVCTPDYYNQSIRRMNHIVNPDLYVFFSDDIGWCRDNLSSLVGDRDAVFVDWNKGANSYKDMQLMSLCAHHIIANSSFSWWGAWLNHNPDKVVFTPSKWKNDAIINDPICDSWHRILV